MSGDDDDDEFEGLNMMILADGDDQRLQTLKARKAAEKQRMAASDRQRVRATGKTSQMNIKCRPEWHQEVAEYSEARGIKINETMERGFTALKEKEGLL